MSDERAFQWTNCPDHRGGKRNQREASRIGNRTDGRGVTCQCWNIVKKILEVDCLLRSQSELRSRVHEVHPEVSFCMLAGKPLSEPKRKSAGKHERGSLLETIYAPKVIADAIGECRPLGAKADDVLDALVALWSAERIYRGTAACFPAELTHDRFDLRMQILA